MGKETDRPRTTRRGHSLDLRSKEVWHELESGTGRDLNLLYRRYPQNNLAGRQDNVDD